MTPPPRRPRPTYRSAATVGLALMVCAGAATAWAQPQRAPRIWDIPLGTHVRNLPASEFVDPACGTNGGPAGLPIRTFEAFQRCPQEASGLREVWFIYDDTLEYIARAWRESTTRSATAVLDQPVTLSLLIDPAGLVAGYRIFTDPRADPELRLAASEVTFHFKARFGLEGDCTDLPRAEGETPIEGLHIKELCERQVDGMRVTAESRHFYKPGQQLINPFNNQPMINAFESWARLEVLQVVPLPAAAVLTESAKLPEPAAPFADQRAAFLAGETVDCPACDLAEAELRRRDLTGANLSGANLTGALLHRAILRRADLSGANLALANLNRADLGFANLRGASLFDAMLYDADAARADFSGAVLDGALMGKAQFALANFEGASLAFADLGEARLNDANLVNATVNVAYMRLAVLLRADLRGSVFKDANMSEANLRGADLGGAVFRSADLFGADLADADLSGADFRGARLLSANLADANQTGTMFAGAVMPDNSIHP